MLLFTRRLLSVNKKKKLLHFTFIIIQCIKIDKWTLNFLIVDSLKYILFELTAVEQFLIL